jgi:hypothetical protein
MKSLIAAAILTSLFAVPISSMASGSDGQLTRADVIAQLVALEQVGYQPSAGDRNYYPDDIQLAEQRVAQAPDTGAAQSGQVQSDAGYGGSMSQTASGGDHGMPMRAPSTCVGPVSYCQLFFGS